MKIPLGNHSAKLLLQSLVALSGSPHNDVPSSGALAGQRVSALCAIDYTGVISVETVDTKEHSVTSEVFLAWIKCCVLPQMQAAPLSRSVLVLDNARIHDRVRLEIACTAVGVVVLWLPAYLCDFSPIELVFNKLILVSQVTAKDAVVQACLPGPTRWGRSSRTDCGR